MFHRRKMVLEFRSMVRGMESSAKVDRRPWIVPCQRNSRSVVHARNPNRAGIKITAVQID